MIYIYWELFLTLINSSVNALRTSLLESALGHPVLRFNIANLLTLHGLGHILRKTTF
jgi:hypothetical protein